jgi:hypothetical protein
MFTGTPDQSGSAYEIRVQDHLGEHWIAFFEGWSLRNMENGEVLLTNPNIDQAGLHGVLNKIRDLNLTLVSVNRINRKNGDGCST